MDAKCAHHPDLPADGGTCERCGTFVCAGCAVAGSTPAICRPCLKHLDSGKYVKHARILSILLGLHGLLLLSMAVYALIFGGAMSEELLSMPVSEDPSEPSGALLSGFFAGLFGIVTLAHATAGTLQCAASWFLFHHRGLTLTWVAIAASFLTLLGCYCFPGAMAIAAYGAFVLSRDDVRARFAVSVPAASSKI